LEVFMKKRLVLVIMVLAAAGMVSARTWGHGRGPNWNNSAQPLTVTGILGLQNGVIVIANEQSVYYAPALGRYIGFIEELKEGAQVTVDGYAYGNRLQVVQLTVKGKSYDFAVNRFGSNRYGPGYYGAGGRQRGRGPCCW
jgi:hypothetical protein